MPTKHTDAAPPAAPGSAVRLRPLVAGDLAAIVAIDKEVSGRSRRDFFVKRLEHLAREPAAFVALAAERGGKLVGFVLARLYEGEFGGVAPEAALDAIGVAGEARMRGVGRCLIDGMAAAMRIHGIKEIGTQADWADTELSGFFARMGFVPAPRLVLERAVSGLVR
jgi:N-acetylglutamate synthase-like GNAT family acetyltransferase